MPTSQHWASLQWKAEEGQDVEENSWTVRILLQIRTRIDNETHPHHIDGAGACCSLAVFLWVAHWLVVVGLVKGVQRGVDQVDHQHRVHLAKELTYLDKQTHRCKQTLNREQECLQKEGRWVLSAPKGLFRLFCPPLHKAAAQLKQNHNFLPRLCMHAKLTWVMKATWKPFQLVINSISKRQL